VALAIYVLVPVWKIRRRDLVPVDEEDAPDLVASVRDLSRQAGLGRSPKLLWNPLAPGGGAIAFGRFNRPYVAVGAGLVMQFYTEPKPALAVIRHELAHIVNRDVSKTYLALSLWYAFVLAGLLPLVVMEAVEGGFLTFPVIWRLTALVVLVYAARNAVLRAREYYADAWAGSSEPDRVALSDVLQAIRQDQSVRLKRFWSMHPTPGSRATALADPDALFRPHLADLLAAGVLAGFSYPMVKEFLFLVVPVEHTLSIGPAWSRRR
jgi:Zn-dependent protease with chaperone function